MCLCVRVSVYVRFAAQIIEDLDARVSMCSAEQAEDAGKMDLEDHRPGTDQARSTDKVAESVFHPLTDHFANGEEEYHGDEQADSAWASKKEQLWRMMDEYASGLNQLQADRIELGDRVCVKSPIKELNGQIGKVVKVFGEGQRFNVQFSGGGLTPLNADEVERFPASSPQQYRGRGPPMQDVERLNVEDEFQREDARAMMQEDPQSDSPTAPPPIRRSPAATTEGAGVEPDDGTRGDQDGARQDSKERTERRKVQVT